MACNSNLKKIYEDVTFSFCNRMCTSKEAGNTDNTCVFWGFSFNENYYVCR